MNKPIIFFVGAFPPPVHGMAMVNFYIFEQLKAYGLNPVIFDISGDSLDRRIRSKFKKILKVIIAIYCLLTRRGLHGDILYISISGGMGQVFDIIFAILAQFRKMFLVMHHHSFSYLDIFSFRTKLLVKFAGKNCIHLTLCDRMANRLKMNYKVMKTCTISNSVFCYKKIQPVKESVKTLKKIGFISNISAEKGIIEFLHLMKIIQNENLPIKGIVAGPFINIDIERFFFSYLKNLHNVEYVGPKYGVEKDDFFQGIDALVFPTRYIHEAEPMVVLEAMRSGLPVISYDRGCISALIGREWGKVVSYEVNFPTTAFEVIKNYFLHPNVYERASFLATSDFNEIYLSSNQRWENFLCILQRIVVGQI